MYRWYGKRSPMARSKQYLLRSNWLLEQWMIDNFRKQINIREFNLALSSVVGCDMAKRLFQLVTR